MATDRLRGARIGCAMTGSFCTFERAFQAWQALRDAGAELYPMMSANACGLDTRFLSAKEAQNTFRKICGRDIWTELTQVEPIGPKKLLDAVVVSPCTGNTMAKLALGLTDTAVAMAVKSHLRNGGPVVLAISTNDGLSRSAGNLGMLMQKRNFFFVPFGQDDCVHKPDSLVAHFDLLPETLDFALNGQQIQPLLRLYGT